MPTIAQSQNIDHSIPDPRWKDLYKVGGISSLLPYFRATAAQFYSITQGRAVSNRQPSTFPNKSAGLWKIAFDLAAGF